MHEDRASDSPMAAITSKINETRGIANALTNEFGGVRTTVDRAVERAGKP
jgi:hypothetical protein